MRVAASWEVSVRPICSPEQTARKTASRLTAGRISSGDMSCGCACTFCRQLPLLSPNDGGGYRNADEIQGHHGQHEDQHGLRIRGGSDDRRDDSDNQDRVTEILPEKLWRDD